MYATALLKIHYHVENELIGKRRKCYEMVYLLD